MSPVRKPQHTPSREHGQVAVFFALLLPVLLALSAVVIGIGNWYTHARHLQTKSDAGAFAGGNSWAFPCGPEVEARIEAQARLYSGPSNPQVGGVPNADVHSVLNGPLWYDDDSNNAPIEKTTPPGTDALAPICSSMTLDVKMTEDNSFPLASLMPLFPDIKKKARVEIQEAEGLSGVLPIAVRAPVPVSAAAVFFNESNGNILGARYMVKNQGILGLPGGLQGWTTFNPDDSTGSWASFQPASETGVLVAVSFRGACDTGLPANNATSKRITTSPGPSCFEDQGFANVNGANGLCNQGGGAQIVNCFWASGTWPNEVVQKGLHFIRGYDAQSPASLGNAPPEIEGAWLEAGTCPTNGYFYTHPTASCNATLRVQVNLGSVMEDEPPSPPNLAVQTRRAENVEVKWGMRRSDGSTDCGSFGNTCDLNSGGNPNAQGVVTYSGTVPLNAQTRSNAIAIQIRVKGSSVSGPGNNCGPTLGNYSDNCRWFHVGSGIISTSVNPVQNNGGIAVLQSPVQRGFRGDSIASGSAKWLRLTQDTAAPCDLGNRIDNDAASADSAANRCFLLDVGLKGGIAQTANEEPTLFNDGIGSSQMGSLDCDPNIQQGQVLIDGVIQGCGPWYAQHPFDWNPLCPSANNIFTTPNPGAPWDDGRWPPLRCIKTRPTGAMNQLERGLDGRFFGNQNTNQCPSPGPGFVKGRNYWDKDTPNGYVPPPGEATYGYKEGSHDTNFNLGDPRNVTIFLTTTEAFAGSGQFTYPITGFIQVYITGYGRINGGGINVDDPCPGSAPPNDLDLGAGNTSGYAVWGHIINYAIPGPRATPSGKVCTPVESTQPCVPVLVE
jgi:putative Flp pilus-assembly TadE/G-like protein